jgi:hypothetical protein
VDEAGTGRTLVRAERFHPGHPRMAVQRGAEWLYYSAMRTTPAQNRSDA